MGRITRELRTLPGAILGITFLLIVTFWVWNLIATRGGPVSGFGGFILGHASGTSYSVGGPAAPAMVTSPYSVNNNLGPYL
jgi:hypothetical protein